ncbi:hypothetical protein FACS189421_13620 [Bacteroidia bacterium]|nr:hypothetical protein FACS189421_13620 [Bacteroidia bacterium]GHT45487.1 hypothetical protein FACS189440_01590 [Bacteroidia bacterium]
MLTLLIWGAASMDAQVTIGGEGEPHDFSVLELISNGTGGLRLPQLSQVEKETAFGINNSVINNVDESMGLQIFNTSTQCIETWNGNMWLSVCSSDAPVIISEPQGTIFVTERNGVLDETEIPTLSLVATGGAGGGTIAYQWYECRYGSSVWSEIPLATNSTYTPESPAFGSTLYRVKAENLGGAVYSKNIEVVYGCGVYAGTGVWKTFQCFNLGVADQSVDPFTPTSDGNLIGNYYQWGRKDPVANVNTGADAIDDWDVSVDQPATSWYDNGKTENGPCPTGWRVPTMEELNTITYPGFWTGVGTLNGTEPYLSGFANLGRLFLPAAGYRVASDGSLSNIGRRALYMTSSETAGNPTACRFLQLEVGQNPTVKTNSKSYGNTIRCILDI